MIRLSFRVRANGASFIYRYPIIAHPIKPIPPLRPCDNGIAQKKISVYVEG